jgi:hypothetical protein
MVAAGSGLALLIFMFVPWYRNDRGFDVQSLSAWKAFAVIDLVLFLAAALAIGLGAARAARAMPRDLPASPATIVAGAGALAALLVLYRIVELPDPGVEGVEIGRKIGVYLGLIASIGIALGGLTAMSEGTPARSSRRRRRR